MILTPTLQKGQANLCTDWSEYVTWAQTRAGIGGKGYCAYTGCTKPGLQSRQRVICYYAYVGILLKRKQAATLRFTFDISDFTMNNVESLLN